MKKDIWCFLGFHKWEYSKNKLLRRCKKCPKHQRLINAGEEVSGMASAEFWVNDKR